MGTAGWDYPDWRGIVYPTKKKTKSFDELAYLARYFDTVEINSTFYRLAKPSAVENWVRDTPEDFVFAAKASQYLTHMKRLTGIEEGVRRLAKST